jgi:hypothetical protein
MNAPHRSHLAVLAPCTFAPKVLLICAKNRASIRTCDAPVMSHIFYYLDSKGKPILVHIDPAADSKELGDKIKAIVARREEDNISPTDCAVPSLPSTLPLGPLRSISTERGGVAPEERDSTQVASLRDVDEIKKQAERRSLVDTWLSNEASDVESGISQDGQNHSLTDEVTNPALESEPGRTSLVEVLETFRMAPKTVDDNQRNAHASSRTPLLTPNSTPSHTTDGELRKLPDIKPFYSAYEMAHEELKSPEDQLAERKVPKRMDSTSMANVMTYQRQAAEWDNKSITATVGSKKTIESIYDGTSIKDLSLSEHKGRERGATLSDTFDKFRKLMPRRSSSKLSTKKKEHSPTDSPTEEKFPDSRHKRSMSTTSLMPPAGDSTSNHLYNVSVDTNGYLTTNDRRSSEIPDTSGANSPLTRLRRSLSKGEKRKSFTESGSTPHIVGLIRREGGPPVSTALVSPLHEHSGLDDSVTDPTVRDEEEEDDDYDDEVDSDNNLGRSAKGVRGDLSIQTIDITPDINGFRQHALSMYPDMEPFLADRVAHEQIRRFKELKGHKIRHVQDVHKKQCASGKHCPALGGGPTYLPARGNNKGEKNQIFRMEGHAGIDEPGVTYTTFQQGIPEPPVDQLPATFECSLCYKERREMSKPSDWTKHVHEDLQPFTCTFSSCTTEKKSFKRKADWVRHENECHRHLDEWRCSFPECQHVCYRSDNFSQHLIREHKVPDFQNKTRGSISSKIKAQPNSQYGQEEQIAQLHRTCRSASTAKPESEPCAFCKSVSPSWKKHQVHLSKHMEALALPVLGLIAQEEVSPDTIVSPIKREHVPLMMRSTTISDVIPANDPQALTPYSTNGSSFHRGSPASQSPIGYQPMPTEAAQFSSYLVGTTAFSTGLIASQSPMDMPTFTAQHISSPMDGSSYGQLGYGPKQSGYLDLDTYQHNDPSLQRDSTPLYESRPHMQSFTPINHSTPNTYPSTNARGSPAHTQLHPLASFPTPDQISGNDYANSPHSTASQHHSTTPSPQQLRASLRNNQLHIPRSGPVVGQIPTNAPGNYTNAYLYSDQQAPYGSPLEAGQYSNDFQAPVGAQEFVVGSTALDYNARTSTSLPIADTIYDAPQYGVYAPHPHAPYTQPYQYQ